MEHRISNPAFAIFLYTEEHAQARRLQLRASYGGVFYVTSSLCKRPTYERGRKTRCHEGLSQIATATTESLICPPCRKDYQINSSSILSGNHRFPITDFSGNRSKLILPEFLSCNRFTNISGNPCSSPSHIASDPAKLSGNSMEFIPQYFFR